MTGKTCLKCWLFFMPGTCPAPSSSEKHFTRSLFGWGVSNIFSYWISNIICWIASVLDAAWLTGIGKETYKQVSYRDILKTFGTSNKLQVSHTIPEHTYLTSSLGPLFCTNLLYALFINQGPATLIKLFLTTYTHDRVSEAQPGLENEVELKSSLETLRKGIILCLSF